MSAELACSMSVEFIWFLLYLLQYRNSHFEEEKEKKKKKVKEEKEKVSF